MLKTKFIEVDGLRIRYADEGSGDPVLLIHGFPENLQSWSKNVPELAKRFRAVAVDVVGFGGSDKAPWGFDCVRLGQFIAKFCAAAGIRSAHIAAMDTGALIALGFAAEYPEMVRKLLLFSGTAYAEGISAPEVKLLALKPLGEAVFLPFGQAALRIGLGKGYSDSRRIDPALAKDYIDCFASPESRRIALRIMRELGTGSDACMRKLKARPPETLILWSKMEKYFYPWVPERMKEDLKARLEYVDGAGHCMQEEIPDYFNRTALGFFGSP